MNQYIVCRVGEHYFTVPILSTNRIIALENVTHVPDTTAYIMGIIESEEEVLPIIDLSKRFYDESMKHPENAQILIVYWQDQEIGLAVDEVVAIKEFEASQIDYDLSKISNVTINSDRSKSPLKSFIRTEERILLELEIDNLFEVADIQENQALFDIEED